MLVVEALNSQNLPQIAPLYEIFRQVAERDYGWPLAAIDFDGLSQVFSIQMLDGYLVREIPSNEVVGFVFYRIETFGAFEIKVIYLKDGIPVKSALDTIMPQMLKDLKDRPEWNVASYPLMGNVQQEYVQFLPWYGFKPVGQSVVKFFLTDGISTEVLDKIPQPELPEGYKLTEWDERYENDIIDILTESFSDSVDALWDPRFRDKKGLTEAMNFLKSGSYGIFYPPLHTILLNASGKPVGVCLMNIVSVHEANIPLIGLLSSERNHQLGKRLLAESVKSCVAEVRSGRLSTAFISATVATSNYAAIRMYRHTGFREDHWYPHVYQDRESVLSRKERVWC